MRNFITRFPHAVRRPGLALFGLLIIGLVQAAYAQTPAIQNDDGIYTTVDDTVVTNTTTDNGSGTVTSESRTTNSVLTTTRPSAAQMRNDAWKNDPNAAQFPYDSTGGAHRNDLDTARKGFDDPRNPWDGRYANDNPANYPAGSAYDRGEPVTNYTPGKYRPGAFGTSGSRERGGRNRN